jgi:pSer/pThr/pTyr-binding forkhead associated (FHA) protein
MLQLKVLSGKKAGCEISARHFPFRVGRSAEDDLQLEDAGVWERHAEVDFFPPDGLILHAQPEAFVTINGNPVQQALLRNGDLLELGGVKIELALSPAPQRSFAGREWLTWGALGTLVLSQMALIYWLLEQ